MKKILLFFLVISSSALAGSMLGLDALGKEDVAGIRKERSYGLYS